MKKLLGIGIISWDRPKYLGQLIESLEINNLDNTEFHLFQDGAICRFTGKRVTGDEDIERSVRLFRSSLLPKKQIHWQLDNVNVAINECSAMYYLSRVYKQFIFLENDVIVSPNFIALMRRGLDQFEEDKRVACISPSFKLYCDKHKVREDMGKLIFRTGHFWAEACWSEKWRKIEKAYIPYYNIVKTRPYRKRGADKIRKLFEETNLLNPNDSTSQDAGKDWAIKRTGMRRLRFVVNRATGIGDYGIHNTPDKLRGCGDGHNTIYSSNEELAIEKFKIVDLP